MKLAFNRKYLPVLATALVMGLIFLFGAVRYSDQNFTSLYNLVGLFRGGTVVGIAAIGATFVILSGGIDLSVGAVIAFITIFVATMISPEVGPGWHPLVVLPLALVIGVVFGTIQGCLIHFFELPPFLVTLAGMFLARGLGFIVHEQSLGIRHSFYTAVRDAAIPLTQRVYLPITVVVLLVCFAVAIFVAHMTRFGRDVYAVGGSEDSARLMGVNIGRVKIAVYAIGGFFAALAGVVATLDMSSGNPAQFVGYELDAIASVVIGGTLLTGGVGFVLGTLMGVLILGLIRLIIDNEGTLSTWWTNISTGLLLFAFITFQSALSRLTRRRAKAA